MLEPDVSRETRERWEAYAALLRRWTKRINLISPATVGELEIRHIADSAQLLSLIGSEGRLCDLGSGGGLPIVVLACAQPDREMVAIESDIRKATFLRTCARELAINLKVEAKRIEQVEPVKAHVLTARALSPLSKLLDQVQRHLVDGGVAVLPKGQHADREIAEAREHWSFRLRKTDSITSENATILTIRDIARV